MAKTVSFKRLILRAVLRQVSPMVIRLVSVSDHMPLPEFHDVFRIILGWNGDLGYIIRVHGQEFNSFRRKTRSKALHEFKLHRQEKFLYVCDTLDMWEWDVRVLDIQDGVEGDHAPVCVGGRGATVDDQPSGQQTIRQEAADAVDATGPIFCCRPGLGSSTRIWTTYSAVGIQNSGRNHKRRNKTARRLDPRLFDALRRQRLGANTRPGPCRERG
jgi:Plasmid pRiA4b ORF-3-like protein